MRPSSALWSAFLDGPRHRVEAEASIRSLGASLGVPVLEPDPPLVDEEHYADLAHLNQAGMRRFSEAVGERLAAAVEEGALKWPASSPSRRAPSPSSTR
jgi:hypothetical protein